MKKEEFAEKMQDIADRYERDPEAAHIKADDLMIEALLDLGYVGGIPTFVKMTKWYA